MRKLKLNELGRLSIEEFKKQPKENLVIVLDNIRSLSNIGSVFRTADAFRVQAIYLCGITATPPHREIRKTALGSTESVDWKYFNNISDAILELKQNHFDIIAIEQCDESILLHEFVPETKKKYALIFGNEIDGVSDNTLQLADLAIEIPQYGTKHSFNISVSVGIVLWDLFSKINF